VFSALILWPVLVAVEAPIADGQALSFDAALGLARSTPAVMGRAQAAHDKAALDDEIAAVPFNPQLTVQPGWRFSPADARQPELLAEIVQPWNLSGHSGARRRAARVEEDALLAQARVAALDARLGAARAWIDVWAAERLLEEARREEAIAGELERLVARAASLRALTRADLAEARAYHAEARGTVLAAEGDLYLRGVSLSREVGSPEVAPLRTAGPLPSPPIPSAGELAALLQQAVSLPLVEARALQARAARAREIEDHAARGTILQLGAVVQRDAPGGLVVSGLARVTFPFFERGERERAGMRAEAAALDGERAQALLTARADVASSVHEVEHTGAMLAVIRDDLVPASREAAQTRRRIFENGGATLLEVLQSDRAAVVAASRQWRIDAEHAWARTKLWLLLAEVALRGARP